MGGSHVVVEAASRDVARILQFHKVLPQVQVEVNLRLQELTRASLVNVTLRDAAPNVPSSEVASWIVADIVNRVIDSEIPAAQVADAERKMSAIKQELTAAREQLVRRDREVEFLQERLRNGEEAKEYLMQSYFREVATLRHHILDLQTHSAATPKVASSATLHSMRSTKSFHRGKLMESSVSSPTSATHAGQHGGGPLSGEEGSFHSLMAPLETPLTNTHGGGGGGERGSPGSRLGLPMATFSSSLNGLPTDVPLQSTPTAAASRSRGVGALSQQQLSAAGDINSSGGVLTPMAEIDALFDYEKYVTITNDSVASWPERYDALEKKFSDTVHQMQLSSASTTLQSAKTISTLQKEAQEKDAKLSTLSNFVSKFQPIILSAVRQMRQKLLEENRVIRREVVAMQRDFTEQLIQMSDHLSEVERRMDVFARFTKYATQRLSQKLRLLQSGNKVTAYQTKPLWQFFLLSGGGDVFGPAKMFWQDQTIIKDLLETYKEMMISAERISQNAFGPPSDDEQEVAAAMEAEARQLLSGPSTATTTGGRGRGNRGTRGRGGRGIQQKVGGTQKDKLASSASTLNSSSPSPSLVKKSDGVGKRSVSPSTAIDIKSHDVAKKSPLTGDLSPTAPSLTPQTPEGKPTPQQATTTGDRSTPVPPPLQPPPVATPPSATTPALVRESSITKGTVPPTLSATVVKKAEEFIQGLVRRLVESKIRRIMCRMRRKAFFDRLPVATRNAIAQLNAMDEEIARATTTVEKYEKRRTQSEGKYRKDVLQQSIHGGNLFSTLLHGGRRLTGASSTAAGDELRRSDSVATVSSVGQGERGHTPSTASVGGQRRGSGSGLTVPQLPSFNSNSGAVRRRSTEALWLNASLSSPPPPVSNASAAGNTLVVQTSMDNSELQQYTAFQPVSGVTSVTVSVMGRSPLLPGMAAAVTTGGGGVGASLLTAEPRRASLIVTPSDMIANPSPVSSSSILDVTSPMNVTTGDGSRRVSRRASDSISSHNTSPQGALTSRIAIDAPTPDTRGGGGGANLASDEGIPIPTVPTTSTTGGVRIYSASSTATPQPPPSRSRQSVTTILQEHVDHTDTVAAESGTTILPLLLAVSSPQPPLSNYLLKSRLVHPVMSSMVPQTVDDDDDDAQALRIHSYSAYPTSVVCMQNVPQTARGAPPRRVKSEFVVPTLPSATSRGIAEKSREMYSHELQLKTGIGLDALLVRPPSSRAGATPLPDLRMSTKTPAIGAASGTAVPIRSLRTPSPRKQ